MVTRCYEDIKCEVGVILGTGTNACYIENMSNIKKYNGNAYFFIQHSTWKVKVLKDLEA
jgi:hexokinase